ncbi:alcohol dehydrogenase, zinc-binding [Deferribacter desulfuricans SSM1]|uniref:Alcohol dehydrogenase, zinc-binding n=1 Tax=Deferribacter desulfuricans (strain DSM 14783 / JCM 11476 / NBRC 101012 / SSM1) TaxID=639282 RepID=D3P9J3_DEFDS|nr:zinc-dependent alcohol dehydrogenase family protein [Deferribacter desulfuricans]BAI81383.1 alcohol dehydrogenase, zinc-binding [Deferribacter desulfuricans SSM1]
MKALVIDKLCNVLEEEQPLTLVDLPIPEVGRNEILVEVSACGVCHTELDEIEGRTPPPVLPVIPGHQIVGRVVRKGEGVTKFDIGDRVGIGWIYSACGECEFCKKGLENLCTNFKATGRDANGGYAEYFKIGEDYAVKIPDYFSDYEAAPLLCAGAIGYRSLKLANINNGDRLGLTGFGASAHLVLKLVNFLYPDTEVFVFARNPAEREFALSLGAVWAGDTADFSPEKLHAIIDTTPVWKPIVEGMKNLLPSGRMVINAIRKEDVDKDYLLNIRYEEHLWLEKEIKSVANVTLKDIDEFINIAADAQIKPEYQLFDLEEANKALKELKNKKIKGAKVLKIK